MLRWLFLAGLILILLKVGYDLLSYPAVLGTAGSEGVIYLALLAVIFAIYGTFVFYVARARTTTANAKDAYKTGL